MQGSAMEPALPSANECDRRGDGIKGSSNSWLMLRVHAGLVMVQLCYAGSYVLNRVALTSGVHPIVFAVYRDTVCMSVLAPIALIFERPKRPPLTFQLVALLVASGFFGGYLTQMFLLFGVAYTSAAYGATISILTPLFTFIISAVFRFEQIRWKRRDGQAKVGGLICAVCGAVLLGVYLGPVILGQTEAVVDPPMSDLGPDRSLLALLRTSLQVGRWQLGISLLFLAGFTLSLTISIQVPILERYPSPMAVAVNTFFLGALFLLVTASIVMDDWSKFVLKEKSAVISIVYNGIGTGAFSFTVIIWSVKNAGPILPAAYTPLQLFASYSMAYVFLGETIHLGSVLGAALIMTGLGFITWGQVKNRAGVIPSVKAMPPLEGVSASTAIAASIEEPLLG